MKRFLNEKQVSAIIGLSVAWLQRRRCYGGGPEFTKFNRAVRYREDNVMKWLESAGRYKNTSQAKVNQTKSKKAKRDPRNGFFFKSRKRVKLLDNES